MNNNNQHIPSGYKPSPLGIIPEDWEVKRLGDFSRFFSGGTPKSGNPLFYNGNIPFIRSGEINKGKTELFLSQEGVDNSSAKLVEEGDILYALYGANSGQCSLSKIQGAINQAILCIRPKANKYYVMSVLQLNKEHYYNSFLQGGQGNLSGEIVSNYRLAIPPIEEQERICNVLQLWDTAIAKQTALIEKLTLCKRGLMQQLLTGKKRLKGFEGEWKNIMIGSIAERITRKNEEDNKNVVTISAQRGFVVQTDFFNKSVASEILDGYFLVHKDEFCYNKSYSNGYPMGAIKRLKSFDKAVVTTLYICFRLKEKLRTNIDFFEQYCESGLLNKELVKVANEGGRAHGLLNVTPADFFNMHMRFPLIEEQTAIASVLVNADKEIEIHKQKLAAMQEQKKGLMQVLLTGKRRIKIN